MTFFEYKVSAPGRPKVRKMTSSIKSHHLSLTIASHHLPSHCISQKLHAITTSDHRYLFTSTISQSLRMQFASKIVLALAVISNAMLAVALPGPLAQVLPSGGGDTSQPIASGEFE